MRSVAAGLLVASLLSACAAPRLVDRSGLPPMSAGSLDSGQVGGVHTDLIRKMLLQQQYYAALAHIDEQRNRVGNRPELESLRAEALAALGDREAAESAYQALLRGRYAADAHHGLGLLYVDLEPYTALRHLRRAVTMRPTSARFRNDLGYALMRQGRLGEAQRELATAVELEPGNRRWANNMILLLLVQGQAEAAARMARQAGVSRDILGQLRDQAASWPPPTHKGDAHEANPDRTADGAGRRSAGR